MSRSGRAVDLAVVVAVILSVALAAGANQKPSSTYSPGVSKSQQLQETSSPEKVLQSYFDTLFQASNLTGKEMAAAGGTVGRGKDPYQSAYSYWSRAWQAAHPYQEFEDSWKGTANVMLQKMVPAGLDHGNPRLFVETRNLEAVGAEPRLGIFFYSGFVTLRETPDGWVIAAADLRPEELAFRTGGHQPWRGDPEMVANQALTGSTGIPPGKASLGKNADGTLTVKYNQPGGTGPTVVVIQRQDGIWEVLEKD